MLQLANRTPYAVQVTILPDRRGVEAVVLIVQGSFRLGSGAVAEDQAPLVMADAWVGEPGQGALRDASDLALEKPATDVLLTGVARPPGGRATPFFASAFSVGPVRKEVAVIEPPAYSRTPHTFSHIFSGGYAAGYYSYKWAEVLSADAYAAFEEAAGSGGAPLSTDIGRLYRQHILEVGGSRPAMASFKAFRGREPSIDALLRHQGMA
jgi:hypothetical protein